jgi:hypothetical protein
VNSFVHIESQQISDFLGAPYDEASKDAIVGIQFGDFVSCSPHRHLRELLPSVGYFFATEIWNSILLRGI